ncbi:MAG: hypothetical protein ACYC26_16530 [Phycisphaerales bacterium]
MKKLQRHGERFKGLTLGLDLHKKMIQYSVLDEQGDETANEQMAARPAELSALVDRLATGGQALQGVPEAGGCFIWAYDLLAEKIGKANVHVAAPSRVRPRKRSLSRRRRATRRMRGGWHICCTSAPGSVARSVRGGGGLA